MNRAVVALLVLAAFGGAFFVDEASGRIAAVGSLTLKTEVLIKYPETACPAGAPASFQCFDRTGSAAVPGLGTVQESYDYVLENAPAGCVPLPGDDAVRLVPTTVRLTVAGKGAVDLSTSGTGCLSRPGTGTFIVPETFTITGGSGAYAGASGSGTIETHSSGPPNFTGIDLWDGTLNVPGYAFDLTPPTISGAKNRTVRVPHRAKSARVNYTVTAVDDVDSNVPVTCRPRSGSPFRLGHTRVTCSATDTSANTRKATFTITVKRR